MEEIKRQYPRRNRAVSYKKDDFFSDSLGETSSEEKDSFLTSSPDESSPNATHFPSKSAKIPDPTRNNSNKKRPLLRKEIQRRYRERQKLQKELACGTASQVDEDLDTLIAEHRALDDERVALLIGLHQANLMINFLKSCRVSNAGATASAAAGEIHFPFSPNNPNQVADALFSNALHGYEPSEYLIRQYAMLSPSILIERDKLHFGHVLDTMMAEWFSTYSTRNEVAIKLQKLFNTRRRISIIVAKDSPNKHKQIMSTAIQPPPGSELGDLATKNLKRISTEIILSGQQLEAIREAWLEYVHSIEALNFDVQMAQITIKDTSQSSANQGTPALSKAVQLALQAAVPGVQQKQAQEFLNLSDTVTTLFQSSRRMSISYTRLAAAVLSTLDVIQLAKLFRGCRPYFPDHVQLCKIILGVEV